MLEQFFMMGGYGMYIWPAYLITAAVLIANIIIPIRRSRASHS